jgi:hypothetical protein
MARLLRALGYLGVWLLTTLVCAAVGVWWPVRSVAKPWAGDGIGMMMFGVVGLVIGGFLGLFAVAYLHNRRARRIQRRGMIPQTRDPA